MSTIFSDGGSDNRGHAGAACIVVDGAITRSFAFYLGKATNNEGEIFSSLAGFAFCLHKGFSEKSKLKWVSDSEYALKSATQYIFNWEKNGWKTSQKDPVKNQGLWKTFLKLTRDLKFEASHVKGHSGHPENEACDDAVGWVRTNSEEFSGDWLKEVVELEDLNFSPWFIRDARGILAEIREAEEEGMDRERLVSLLDFSKLDFVTPPSRKVKESIADTPVSIELEVRKLSLSYLKKLKTLDPSGDVVKSEKEFGKAISSLKTWLKLGQ